jgi:hypothetical protein
MIIDGLGLEHLLPLLVISVSVVKCQGHPSSSPFFAHSLVANDSPDRRCAHRNPDCHCLSWLWTAFALQSVAARLTPPAHLLSRDPTRPTP